MESQKTTINVKVFAGQTKNGILDVDVCDRYGNRPVRLRFDNDGKIKATNGSKQIELQSYVTDNWYEVKIEIDAQPYGSFNIEINGIQLLKNADLAEAVKSVERISFRTGPYRDLPNRKTPNETPVPPLEGADKPVEMVQFYIDDLSIK
jgi:hypothetical protein